MAMLVAKANVLERLIRRRGGPPSSLMKRSRMGCLAKISFLLLLPYLRRSGTTSSALSLQPSTVVTKSGAVATVLANVLQTSITGVWVHSILCTIYELQATNALSSWRSASRRRAGVPALCFASALRFTLVVQRYRFPALMDPVSTFHNDWSTHKSPFGVLTA
jgi:hypothetical protein